MGEPRRKAMPQPHWLPRNHRYFRALLAGGPSRTAARLIPGLEMLGIEVIAHWESDRSWHGPIPEAADLVIALRERHDRSAELKVALAQSQNAGSQIHVLWTSDRMPELTAALAEHGLFADDTARSSTIAAIRERAAALTAARVERKTTEEIDQRALAKAEAMRAEWLATRPAAEAVVVRQTPPEPIEPAASPRIRLRLRIMADVQEYAEQCPGESFMVLVADGKTTIEFDRGRK